MLIEYDFGMKYKHASLIFRNCKIYPNCSNNQLFFLKFIQYFYKNKIVFYSYGLAFDANLDY